MDTNIFVTEAPKCAFTDSVSERLNFYHNSEVKGFYRIKNLCMIGYLQGG